MKIILNFLPTLLGLMAACNGPPSFDESTMVHVKNNDTGPVILRGDGFYPGLPLVKVSVGGQDVSLVHVINPQEVQLVAGPRPGVCGPVEVTLTNPDGQSVTSTRVLAYDAPYAAFAPLQDAYTSTNDLNNLFVGDYNEDHKVDIAFFEIEQNTGKSSLVVLLGQGDGTFAKTARVDALGPIGPAATIAVGDVNEDGHLDFLVPNAHFGLGLSVFLGNGKGQFQRQDENIDRTTATSPNRLQLAEVNHDGHLDLVISNTAGTFGGTLTVLKGKGDGSFSPFSPNSAITVGDASESNSQVQAFDFDLDGNLDLLILAPKGNFVAIGKGDGSFNSPQSLNATSFVPTNFILTGNFTSSPLPQVVLRSSLFSLVFFQGQANFMNNGPNWTSTFASTTTINEATTGDFNGDQKLDLALVGWAAGTPAYQLLVSLGRGDGTFEDSHSTLLDASFTPSLIAAGDFNRDGFPDIVGLQSIPNGRVSVLLGRCP